MQQRTCTAIAFKRLKRGKMPCTEDGRNHRPSIDTRSDAVAIETGKKRREMPLGNQWHVCKREQHRPVLNGGGNAQCDRLRQRSIGRMQWYAGEAGQVWRIAGAYYDPLHQRQVNKGPSRVLNQRYTGKVCSQLAPAKARCPSRREQDQRRHPSMLSASALPIQACQWASAL